MKYIIILTFLFSITLPSLNASVYKGQKYFKQKCLSCHGKAHAFVTEKSYDKWITYLDKNGDTIYAIHNANSNIKCNFHLI